MSKGYRMPAEWQPHERCWMAWPSNADIWPNGMTAARRNFAAVVRAILEFEPVTLLVRPQDREDAFRRCGEQVTYWEYPLDDSWMRDFGPTLVVNAQNQLAGVNWTFNGWGKYPHENDRNVARFILDQLGLPSIDVPLVLEGGSIHVDGEGSVLTTEQCLLHPNRNPQLSQGEIEAEVLENLGAQSMIWLQQGLKDDDTDGHIDEIACFVKPGVALALISNDSNDIDYAPLQNNLSILRNAVDARGRKLEVITVPQPEIAYKGGARLSQSYVNFYIANGGIVMPAFGDRKADDRARGVLSEIFSPRKILQIPARELAYGGGNIHCITQQQPLLARG
ncbi:MAG: agmatine deiminase [Verrucomicrobiaceae bacterium]|nr:agmatine deiminase [Verrucomicrobiaceae bacterium]